MDNLVKYLLDETTIWMPRLIGVIVILLTVFILSKIVKRIISTTAKKLNLDRNITYLIARTSNITLITFGFVTALGTLGINVSALVAGLGLTGFALGFALKDTISNLLSGVLILLYQPFKIGNHINVAGYDGIVISVDLRYTKLDSSDGNKVLIPNSKLFKEPITLITEDKA